MVDDSVKIRQGAVQKTGSDWEDEVIKEIEPKLKQHALSVVKGRRRDIVNKFWKQLYIPTKRKGVWGDIDLIVFNEKQKVVAVISCKVSLHGRFTESVFYWLLFKKVLNRSFKFVFATNDRGRGQEKWKSEWGSEDKPTKDRELAEAYTDGIYVKNPYTRLGGIVKPLEQLADDIIKWRY